MKSVKEIARKMYAGKECHEFEFDSLWAIRNSLNGMTVMARWQRQARVRWVFSCLGLLA